MLILEIRDDVIWMKHLKRDRELYAAVSDLADEETITLRADKIVGKWARMKTGRDGRPTYGIKPVGAMARVWAGMQKRRGEKIRLELPDDEGDAYLRYADQTFVEWYSAEDEEAFGDLQPL